VEITYLTEYLPRNKHTKREGREEARICKDQPTELYCSAVKHKSPANPQRAAPQLGHVPSREKPLAALVWV